MTPIEAKFVEAWKEFKSYAEKDMGYTNKQNIHECLNGAGAFVNFLIRRKPKAGTSYICDFDTVAHIVNSCIDAIRLNQGEAMLAGVDGIKNGWVAAILREDGSTEVHTFPSYRSLIEDTTLASIVIDIPIGLPDYGARACDLEARRCIGQSRRSSVFPAPIRSMLTAHDWKDACRIRWDREGKKCSKQPEKMVSGTDSHDGERGHSP